jgi:hypothetical protein
MRHSIDEKRNTATLANGVQKENVQESEKFTSISNTEFQAFSVRQLFVVEWQMQKVDSKKLNENIVRKGAWST